MDRDCNNCVYSTRDGDCRQWKCNNKGWTVEDIKAEAMEESINILKGLDTQIAEIFENIVKNAEHYKEQNK